MSDGVGRMLLAEIASRSYLYKSDFDLQAETVVCLMHDGQTDNGMWDTGILIQGSRLMVSTIHCWENSLRIPSDFFSRSYRDCTVG